VTAVAATSAAEVFRPIRVRKAADEVVAVIADAIRGGIYRPGDRLPGVRELAERLSVSRNVIGEAIDVLRQGGVVSVRRGKGGGVVVISAASVAGVIAGLHGSTRASIRAALEARRAAEMAAAPLAAARASISELARLESLVAALCGLTKEPETFLQTDISFHYALVEASANPLLANLHVRAITELMAAREPFPSGRPSLKRAIEMQQASFEAIRSRSRSRIIETHDDHLCELEHIFLGERLPYP
jgi:GntR family transcriptional regulator, transcriptional repressor for pyruvate dehydrogenase complex